VKLNGIWNSKYVCELGIKDHCNEVIALNNEIAKYKAIKQETYTEYAKEQLKKEYADLFLILANYFEVEELATSSPIIQNRFIRFGDKAAEESNTK